NGTTFNPGFGDRQGLVMNAGHVIPMFSSNDNAAGSVIKTATVTIAAGPRVVFGDMGPITTNRGPDGTPRLTSFEIDFDRPIEVGSFTGDDVTLKYRDPLTPASLPANLTLTGTSALTITALDAGGNFGPGLSGVGAMASRFRVNLVTPLSGVGTYSYAIAPSV